ncbi:MAG TPA: erythromycin esterase family protein [Thermoanaerobaculia bacterium]|nr:erythromycin esterase family protein [Thermoanaerobaculia bacterium]
MRDLRLLAPGEGVLLEGADLAPLREVVGDARVVALGEATHGTREFFHLKHHLRWMRQWNAVPGRRQGRFYGFDVKAAAVSAERLAARLERIDPALAAEVGPPSPGSPRPRAPRPSSPTRTRRSTRPPWPASPRCCRGSPSGCRGGSRRGGSYGRNG